MPSDKETIEMLLYTALGALSIAILPLFYMVCIEPWVSMIRKKIEGVEVASE